MTEDDYRAEILRLMAERDMLRSQRDVARQFANRFRDALEKIAFPAAHGTNDLAGNPQKWSTTIAYLALGGGFKDGQRTNTEDELYDEWGG